MTPVQLFGVGLKGISPAIDAQHRINCYTVMQTDGGKSKLALVGTPGLEALTTSLGTNPSRGMWAQGNNLYSVHGGVLYSITNAGVATNLGTIGTITGDVSMADDGTYLVLVDGSKGYYILLSGGVLTQIVDANFPSNPTTVTWQDTYFIVNKGSSNQFNLSKNADPSTWPAVNQNNTGSGSGTLQACLADHSLLMLFADLFTEFWQDAGSPDFPYSVIPGSAQEFGLASPWSLCKFDNSVAGLFKNKMGEVNISRLSGFRLQRMSSFELETTINDKSVYTTVSDAEGFGYMLGGHPMYQISFPTAMKSWLYDQASQVWSELQDTNGSRHWGQKFANFLNQRVVSDYRNGNIYKLNPGVYSDNGSNIPMEVWSKHIWKNDNYIGIQQVQIDVEVGVGLATGQGSNPLIELQVSKDGGNTFASVGFESMGAIGAYTQRVIWRSLGAARDWVLKLRITDPVKRTITGATAQVTGAGF